MNRKVKKPKSTDSKVVAASVNPKKVFDVMKPGKAPANATSRPLIVGHKPQVKDPMMTESQSSRSPLLDSLRKVSLAPIVGKPTAAEDDKALPQADNLTSAMSVPEPSLPAAPAQQSELPQAPTAVSAASIEPTLQPQAPVIDVPSDLTAEDLAALAMHDEAQSVQNSASGQSHPAMSAPELESPVSADQTPGQQPMEAANSALEPPAPATETPSMPTHGQIVVSTHKLHSNNVMIFWAIVFILLLVIVFDALLDAGTFTLNIPHTHFL